MRASLVGANVVRSRLLTARPRVGKPTGDWISSGSKPGISSSSLRSINISSFKILKIAGEAVINAHNRLRVSAFASAQAAPAIVMSLSRVSLTVVGADESVAVGAAVLGFAVVAGVGLKVGTGVGSGVGRRVGWGVGRSVTR